MIDFTVPGDSRIEEKEKDKITKYQDLGRKLQKILNVKVEIIPLVQVLQVLHPNSLVIDRSRLVLQQEQQSLGGEKKDPWWKRCIEEDIMQLRKDMNILKRVKKQQIGACKEGKAKLVEDKYGVKRKG